MKKYRLKLYITGYTAKTNRAITNLRRICQQELNDEYELLVINVLDHPQLAEEEKILATPTLIKTLPPPVRRIIGDLTDAQKVLVALDLNSVTLK